MPKLTVKECKVLKPLINELRELEGFTNEEDLNTFQDLYDRYRRGFLTVNERIALRKIYKRNHRKPEVVQQQWTCFDKQVRYSTGGTVRVKFEDIKQQMHVEAGVFWSQLMWPHELLSVFSEETGEWLLPWLKKNKPGATLHKDGLIVRVLKP